MEATGEKSLNKRSGRTRRGPHRFISAGLVILVLITGLLSGCGYKPGSSGGVPAGERRAGYAALMHTVTALEEAQPYRIIREGTLANERTERNAGLWYITSPEANSYAEYAQTAVQAVLDLYQKYGKDYTAVILTPAADLFFPYYAAASFAADGKGADGLTGSAPANPMYWKVQVLENAPLDERQLAVCRLRQQKAADFPSTDTFSSLSYNEKALREYIAAELGIPYAETALPELSLREYNLPDYPVKQY